jgi:hypothetical protein
MTMPDPASPLLDAARAWYDAGFCVIPSHEDGGKRPFGQWKKYQLQRPDWPTLEGWLQSGRYSGIGLIMGRASGNTEMVEIEGPGNLIVPRVQQLFDMAHSMDLDGSLGLVALMERVYHGCAETSAGGGLHIFIRVIDGEVPGNQKLAGTPDKVIAETRGEGGFVIVWPTPARNGHQPGAAYLLLPNAHPDNTTTVTASELQWIHAVFTDAFGGWKEPAKAPVHKTETDVLKIGTPAQASGLSPFDDYRQRATWRDILEPAGWTHHSKDATHDYWTRPGKDKRNGHSASTIEDGPFYLFSSSVTGMPIEQGLSKGQVYAHLHHDGDLSGATRQLRADGYGDVLRELPSWNPPAQLETDFWTAHPILETVRQAAYARMVSADAVLACLLARVVQHIPYEYAIPPIVGGKSTPNLFVALIGPSGTGKGGARRAADDLLGHIPATKGNPVIEGPLGSGEGIVSLFYEYPRDDDDPDAKPGKNLELYYRGLMILDEEGSALAELIKRQGQVTEQTLLKMWSGERLGFSYSARGSGLRLSVPDGQYRASALLGIQPAAAAFLLDDARSDRGLPQRFLWASTIDPKVPEEELPFPDPLDWHPPRFGTGLDQASVKVSPEIRKWLRKAHHARVTGAGSLGLESHGGLVQLKTATALAALIRPGEPLRVDAQVWDLAGQLKTASDSVRQAVSDRAKQDRDKVAQARQDIAVRQRVAVQEVDAKVGNCARRLALHIVNHHSGEGEHCTKSCARRSLTSGYRDVYEAALERAMELEWIADITPDESESTHYGPGSSRPA